MRPDRRWRGSVRAARELGVEIVLVGKQDVLQQKLKELGYSEGKITIRDAADIITNDDEPGKGPSPEKGRINRRCGEYAEKRGRGRPCFDGCNGGVLAAGLLIVGRIEGRAAPRACAGAADGHGACAFGRRRCERGL